MKIRDIMTRPVEVATTDDTIEEAARKMSVKGCHVLPVSADDRLVGVITDRDIIDGVVAHGKSPEDCCVGEVMSGDVMFVYDDERTEDVVGNMEKLHVKRLPVVDHNKKLVGIVSRDKMAATTEGSGAETAPGCISDQK